MPQTHILLIRKLQSRIPLLFCISLTLLAITVCNTACSTQELSSQKPLSTPTRVERNRATERHPSSLVSVCQKILQSFLEKTNPPKLLNVREEFRGEHLGLSLHFPGKKVIYLETDLERSPYLINIVDGKFWNTSRTPTDSNHTTGMIVLSIDEQLYFSPQPPKSGVFHHSSFVAGQPVLFAGEAEFFAGTLIKITPFSGHYHPTTANILQMGDYLIKNGIDLSKVTIQLSKSFSSSAIPLNEFIDHSATNNLVLSKQISKLFKSNLNQNTLHRIAVAVVDHDGPSSNRRAIQFLNTNLDSTDPNLKIDSAQLLLELDNTHSKALKIVDD